VSSSAEDIELSIIVFQYLYTFDFISLIELGSQIHRNSEEAEDVEDSQKVTCVEIHGVVG